MSNIDRKLMDHRCGAGGTKCPCCNRWFGADKPKLTRMIRSIMKRVIRKEIKQEIE